MTKLSSRKVIHLSAPFPEDLNNLKLDQIVLDCGNSISFDFGSLFYSVRSNARRTKSTSKLVDLSSYNAARGPMVKKILYWAIETFESSGLRPKTISSHIATLFRTLAWGDNSGLKAFLANESDARELVQAYILHLQNRVDQVRDRLSFRTASRYQYDLMAVIEQLMGNSNIFIGIIKLKGEYELTQHTKVPDESDQAKVMAWVKCLFNGFSELSLDFKPYPYSLKIPGYLNWPNNKLWVFPLRTLWCSPPGRNEGLINKHIAYDYDIGRLRTEVEVIKVSDRRLFPKVARLRINNAQSLIQSANETADYSDRLRKGMFAAHSFLIMFIASTGFNPSQAIAVRWSEDLEAAVMNPESTRQGFKMIKYRANHRVVHFEIGVEYMVFFRKYLKLRKYLLRGEKCDFLFFGFKGVDIKDPKNSLVPLTPGAIKRWFIKVSRFCPDIPNITARHWRAAKQDFVIRNHDPMTASVIMQHSLNTAIKNYSNGSDVVHQSELNTFFGQIEKVILEKGASVDQGKSVPMGLCSSPNNPKTISETIPINPNCNTPDGCLSCDKFRIHVDEEDIRKLLSARFCIRIISKFSDEQAAIFQPLDYFLSRIDFLLGLLRGKDRGLVDQIENEVDAQGELDRYWQAKVEMFMELELI